MNLIRAIFRPEVLIFLIPIVAIVCGAVHKITKMRFEHEERLARIEAGLDVEDDY